MDHTAEHAAAAAQVMSGQNAVLRMAVVERLHRAPESLAECIEGISSLPHFERVIYGAESWSDDGKRMCPRCNSEHRGICRESDALAREALP